MLIVLCYDVGDDRRRLRLYQMMQGYGRAVQRSVFECELTASELERLRRRLRRIIDPAADSVRLYVLCELKRLKSPSGDCNGHQALLEVSEQRRLPLG
jgi:CRISPR-associated protein Cas2